MASNTINNIEEVKEIFNRHLTEQKMRKTPERYAILEEIYSRNDHFDAEALYIHMKTQNYRVSRATVYNTLDLLVTCDLVKKHQFGDNLAKYEKSLGYRQHDHLICNDCGKILEFCDPRVQQIKNMMGDLLNFEVTSHSLNLYGNCAGACERTKD
jgi:Fur family ferric uptake transcriptional regulator